ncbi:MAG: tetratricopeptide repeat protein [Deltaproteobacteria bacterium]|nr:tetratricopeptide repeat protein [Deltaproteobacteria bacterium]
MNARTVFLKHFRTERKMQVVEEHSEILESLKEQATFLRGRIDDYEPDEDGRKRLAELVEAIDRASAFLESHPPVKESAADKETAEASQETEVGPVEPPKDADDLDGWLAYLVENPNDEDGLDNLQRIETRARVDEDWDSVIAVLMGKVEIQSDQDARLTHLKEIQRICEQEVGDLAKAFAAAQMAHGLNPTDEELTDELVRLAEATEQWADLVAHFNEVLPTVEDTDASAKMWLLAARIYNERLGRMDYAAAALGKGIEVAPENPDLWDELASLYKANSRWRELAQVLHKRLDVESDQTQKIFYLLELADLNEGRLGDLVEARLIYERVLKIDPINTTALTSLEGICRALELWEPLEKTLRRKLDAAEDGEQTRSIRIEIADLMAAHLEQPEGAVHELESLLPSHPDDEEILQKLVHLYEELDRSEDYIKTAQKLAERSKDDDLRQKLYRRIVMELEMNPETRSRTVEFLEKLVELTPSDETLYQNLEQRYLEDQAWEELAATYRRHVDKAASPRTKAQIFKLLSALQDEELNDPDAAETTIREALAVDAADMEALTALSGLLRRQEKWVDLVDVLSRRAELAEDNTSRADLNREIGEIAATKLGDPETAEQRLMKALELDQENLGVTTALFELYKGRKEWLRASKIGLQAAERTANPIQRAELIYQIAKIHRNGLDDQDRAIGLYHQVLAVDPEHVPSATILADHYFTEETWEEAEPLLDLLVRKIPAEDRHTLFHHESHLGFVARNLKNLDKAVAHLEKARELDPTNREVLDALADLKYKQEEWKAAANLYQAILVGHRQDMPSDKLVELYHRLGTIKLHTKEKDRALTLFEKALEIDPDYGPSTQALIYLRSESEDYDKVVTAKESLFNKASDPQEKKTLALEIAELYQNKLDDTETALDYYEKAVELDPEDHATLHRIMEMHTASEQWDRVADTILRLEAIETDQAIKAKYHYAAGVIYRDELKDNDLAVEQFEACLEQTPKQKQAFDAIERLLTEEGRWAELAKAYRKQYKRLPDGTPMADRVHLLHRMGETYLEKLEEPETAMTAFEAAVALDPNNKERNELLADLYVQAGPSQVDKAIEQHQRLLRTNPYSIRAYKKLCDLYIESRQKDKTWCLCSALMFLKQADDKQRIFYDRYRPTKLTTAKRKLSDSLWQNEILHPDENILLDTVLAGISVPASLLVAQPHKAFGLKRRERIDPGKDDRPFAKLFAYAANVLNITLKPEIFVRGDQLASIQLANTRERNALVPSWLVDPDKFKGLSETAVLFQVARNLAFHRPERYLKRALPSLTDLSHALAAILTLTVPKAPVDASQPAVQKFVEHFTRTIPPMVFEQLSPVAQKLVTTGRKAADLPTWLRATEFTAMQTGLLLCNDFEAVSQQIASEADGVTGIPAKQRVTELLLFSISEQYFTLRQHLGIAVE